MYLCVSLCIILYFTDCSRFDNDKKRPTIRITDSRPYSYVNRKS